MRPSKAQRWAIWLAVSLILAFFLSRLVAIGRFPPFLDEMWHIQHAELSQQSSLFAYSGEGRLFTIWWYMLFKPYLAAPLWLSRSVTLLAVLPGFAAAVAIGRLTSGWWGTLFAGLVYLFSTSNMFFERLALADPVSGSAVLIALYLAYRLSRRVNAWDAALTGIALFMAVGAKATAIPYLGIPAAAALTLYPTGRTWRENARWLVIALGCGLGLVGLFALGLRLRQYAPFGLLELYNEQATSPVLARTLLNIESFVVWFSTYTGILVFILLLIAVVGLIARRQFYLVLCLLGPALAFWVNEKQFTRYFVALAVIFLLIGATFLARLIQKQRRPIQVAGLTCLLIWGLVQWLPFAWNSYNDLAHLALSADDYREYVASDASGFALPEVRDILRNNQPTEVIGVLANCQALRYLALGEFKVTCPLLNPNGTEIDTIKNLMASRRRPGVYVVFEALSYGPATVPGRLMVTLKRPGNLSALSVYSLAP